MNKNEQIKSFEQFEEAMTTLINNEAISLEAMRAAFKETPAAQSGQGYAEFIADYGGYIMQKMQNELITNAQTQSKGAIKH